MIAQGDVRLDAGQVIKAAATFSVAAIAGGSVIMPGDGRFVAGRVAGSTVDAGAVGVDDEVVSSTLTAREVMNLEKGTEGESSLHLHGDGVFGGAVRNLEWRPRAGTTNLLSGHHSTELGVVELEPVSTRRTCLLSGGASHVTVTAAPAKLDQAPWLRMPVTKRIYRLDLIGTMLLSTATTPAQRQPLASSRTDRMTCGEIALAAKSHLIIEADVADIGTVTVAGHANLTRSSKVEAEAIVAKLEASSSSASLTLAPSVGILLEPNFTSMITPESTAVPTIQIIGGTTTVRARLDTVTCLRPHGVDPPQLVVAAGGSIRSLSGPFQLGQLHGRITGGHASANGAGAAQLTGITFHGDDRPLLGGQLIGVDITELDFPALEPLKDLHVFDPDPKTLMDHAKNTRDNQVGDGHRHRGLRERAQRLQLIAEIVWRACRPGGAGQLSG